MTIHRAVRLALKKEAYELIVTDNGTDALRICQEHHPAILIADLDLTGITGGELIKKVQKLTPTKTILLCGNFHQVDEKHLEQIPADAKLWKPFESHVLVTLIRTLIQESGHHQPEATQTIPVERAYEATQQIPRNNQATREIHQDNKAPYEKTRPYIKPEPTRSSEKTQQYQVDPTQTEMPSNMRDHRISSENVRENLWSPEYESFRGEIKTEQLNRPEEKTILPDEDDYYVVDRQSSKTSSYQADPTSADLSSFEETSHPNPHEHNINKLSIYDELNTDQREEIKDLIRTEIDKALNSWFKDKLQERLNDVLKLIENESKS